MSEVDQEIPSSADVGIRPTRTFTEREKYGFDPETAFKPVLIFVALLLIAYCLCVSVLLFVIHFVLPAIS